MKFRNRIICAISVLCARLRNLIISFRSSGKKGVSTGLIIGIVILVVVMLLIALVLTVVCMLYIQKRSARSGDDYVRLISN